MEHFLYLKKIRMKPTFQKIGYPIFNVFDKNASGCNNGIRVQYHRDIPTRVIVIETLSVFNQVLKAKLALKTSVIFVCLKGNSSKSTSGLIHYFKNQLPELKICHFGDCGPEGVSIMVWNSLKVYKNKMPNRNFYDAKWIGIFPSQVSKYDVISYKTLSDRDRSLLVGFKNNNEWMNEKRKAKLKIISDSGKKYESETIFKEIGGFEVFFWDFLNRIQSGECVAI